MRCRWCQDDLPFLKKWSVEDFCSTDHRRQYVEEQDRLIVERLQRQRQRLDAIQMQIRARQAELRRPDPAVAGFLPDLSAVWRLDSYTPAPPFHPQLTAFASTVHPSLANPSAGERTVRSAAALRYTVGLSAPASASRIRLSGAPEPFASAFTGPAWQLSPAALAPRFDARLFRPRPRWIRDCQLPAQILPAVAVASAPGPLVCPAGLAVLPPELRSASAASAVVFSRNTAPAILPGFGLEEFDSVLNPNLPRTALGSAVSPEPRFQGRLLRRRPGAGIAPGGPAAVSVAGEQVWNPLPTSPVLDLRPAVALRHANLRHGLPLHAQSIPGLELAVEGVEWPPVPVAVLARLSQFDAASFGPAPAPFVFLRPVELRVPQSAASALVSGPASSAIPAAPPALSCVPAASLIPAALRSLDVTAAPLAEGAADPLSNAQTWQESSPAIPELRAALCAALPVAPNAAAPVAGAIIATLLPVSTPSSPLAQPVGDLARPAFTGGLALTFTPAMGKLFRMRPRAGVSTASVVRPFHAMPLESVLSAPRVPKLSILTTYDADPPLVTRLQPLCRVFEGGTAEASAHRALPGLEFSSTAILPAFAALKTVPVPAPCRRLYRMRPRGACNAAIAAHTPECQLQFSAGSTVLPALRPADAEPGMQSRLYRMRPRGPVAGSLFSQNAISQQLMAAVPAIALPLLPGPTPPVTAASSRLQPPRYRGPRGGGGAGGKLPNANWNSPAAGSSSLQCSSIWEENVTAVAGKLVAGSPMAMAMAPGMTYPGLGIVPDGVRAVKIGQNGPVKSWLVDFGMLLTRRPQLRWATVAAVVVLTVAVQSKVRSSSAAADSSGSRDVRASAVSTGPFESAASKLRQRLAGRAAVDMHSYFEQNFAGWTGDAADWQKSWSQGSKGTRPGKLALFEPSLPLNNYHFEFMATVERSGLGWAFRARDAQNYEAVKLVTVRAGNLPQMAVAHYSVSNGQVSQRKQTLIPLTLRADTIYQIAMDVQEQTATLYIQNSLIDSWQVEQSPAGGVGFFADRGEQANLQALHITHQNDTLGRLCAYLAPNHTQSEKVNQQ